MSNFHLIFLLLAVLPRQSPIPQASGDSAKSAVTSELPQTYVKCGRDCAYAALRLLGLEANLAELDEALRKSEVCSLSDIRRVLEERDVHCATYRFTQSQLPSLGTVLTGNGAAHESAAVGILHGSGPLGQPGHFVLIPSASPQRVGLLDLHGASKLVDIDSLDHDLSWTIMVISNAPIRLPIAMRVVSVVRRGFIPLLVLIVVGCTGALARIRTAFLAKVETALVAAIRFGRRRVLRGYTLKTVRVALCLIFVWGIVAITFRRIGDSERVVLNPTIVEKGQVPVGTLYEAEFAVRNLTKHLVNIVRLHTDCSCSSAELDSYSIAPLEASKGKVRVRVEKAGRTPTVVEVHTSENQKPLVLRLTHNGYATWKLKPRIVLLGDVPEGETVAHEVDISMDDPEGASVARIFKADSTDPEGIEVDMVMPSEVSPCRDASMRLLVHAGKRGAFHKQVLLRSGPAPATSIGIDVVGQIVAQVEVSPESLYFDAVGEGPLDAQHEICIASRTVPFNVKEVRSSVPWLRVHAEPSKGRVDGRSRWCWMLPGMTGLLVGTASRSDGSPKCAIGHCAGVCWRMRDIEWVPALLACRGA